MADINSHMSRLGVIVIDCKGDDLTDASAFWSGALGYEFKIDDDGKYAVGSSPAGEPRVLLQHVGHDSRVHLDIETDHPDSEQARLEALGAHVVEHCSKGWTVMEPPTGHRFCIVNPQRDDFAANANVWSNG
ncbi:MAG: VOC family protein [Pseudomonadota bacterium]